VRYGGVRVLESLCVLGVGQLLWGRVLCEGLQRDRMDRGNV
jgi:hypothetical protein